MDVRKRRGAVGAATFVVACAACLLAPGFALAGTLDQQQTQISSSAFSIGMNQTVAQTFTAGITGKIDEVDLHLGYLVAPTAALTVEIQSASGGVPTGTALASSSIPTSAVTSSSAFIPVTFTSQASVAAGTQYAIVASSTTPAVNTWEWTDAASTNPYPGGTALYAPPGSSAWANDTTADLTFKTYVVPSPPVPSPSTGPTGQQGAALKKCKKKRSHQKRRKCKKRANGLGR